MVWGYYRSISLSLTQDRQMYRLLPGTVGASRWAAAGLPPSPSPSPTLPSPALSLSRSRDSDQIRVLVLPSPILRGWQKLVSLAGPSRGPPVVLTWSYRGGGCCEGVDRSRERTVGGAEGSERGQMSFPRSPGCRTREWGCVWCNSLNGDKTCWVPTWTGALGRTKVGRLD